MPSVFEKDMVLFDRIKLIELFDNGGQAEIWKVVDLDYPRHGTLALKLRYVPADERNDPQFRRRDERLEAEVNLIGDCQSYYIVRPHFKIGGIQEAGGRDHAYFGVVMDFAPDGSLAGFLCSKEFSGFTAMDRVKLLHQLALGVQAMQHHDIVHNDIKPANILIFRESGFVHPAFADFGYAFKRSETVIFGGTPIYMAPELILKEAGPSYETDLFSLGVVFYEIMMGAHPLEGIILNRDPETALRGHYSTDKYIDFSEAHQRTGRSIVELIERMCARDPSDRGDITDVIDELDTIIKADPNFNSVDLDRYFPKLVDRYRWADSLHHMFGERELLVFLRGGNRKTDQRTIAEWLKGEKLYGFSIMTLLGEHDDLMRIWRRPSEKAALDAVFKRFEAERGPVHVLEPKYHWPVSPTAARFGFRHQSDVLAYLDHLAHGPPPQPRKGSPLAGETKTHREKKKKSNAIRSVCRAVAAKALSNDLVELIGERIYNRLAAIRVFGSVEVFADPGGNGVFPEFVIILESKQFHRIPDVLEVVESTLKQLSEAPPSRTATHFEAHKLSAIESYDGRLLLELFRYQRRLKRARADV